MYKQESDTNTLAFTDKGSNNCSNSLHFSFNSSFNSSLNSSFNISFFIPSSGFSFKMFLTVLLRGTNSFALIENRNLGQNSWALIDKLKLLLCSLLISSRWRDSFSSRRVSMYMMVPQHLAGSSLIFRSSYVLFVACSYLVLAKQNVQLSRDQGQTLPEISMFSLYLSRPRLTFGWVAFLGIAGEGCCLSQGREGTDGCGKLTSLPGKYWGRNLYWDKR